MFSSLKHCRLSADMILVESCCARLTAAAVFPTAVGPTTTMTVPSFILTGFFAFFFTFIFTLRLLFGRRIRTILFFHIEAFRRLGEIIFFLYLSKLIAYQPLRAILAGRNAFR